MKIVLERDGQLLDIYFNGNGAEVDNDLGLMLQLVKCSPEVRVRRKELQSVLEPDCYKKCSAPCHCYIFWCHELKSDFPKLRLVTNRCGGTSLVYESRAYKLRYTGKRLKNWRLWRSECEGGLTTNLDVTAVLRQTNRRSMPIRSALGVQNGKNSGFVKAKRERNETPAIYDEEAFAASAEPSTSDYFLASKRVKSMMYSHRSKRCLKLPEHRWDLQIPVPFRTTKAGENFLLWQCASKHILIFSMADIIRLLAAMKTWGMDGTFKVVLYWYEQLFTIHAFVAGKLVPAVYCLCTGKDIGTYGYIFQALIDKAAVLEVDLNPHTIICDFETALIPAIRGYFPNTRNRRRIKKKDKNVPGHRFPPIPQVDTAVRLLETGITGSLAALFQYFRQEWMTDERLPLWNVYNVNIRTNNHLEGNATVGDLRRVSKVYAEKQRQVAQYTGEYTNGRRTLEQFLEALMTNNHLEGWHNRLNRKAGKGHNGLYELLQLLIAEQGVMDTLIQQVLSGNATVGDLRRVNKVYAEKQQRVAQYTCEYTNGSRTLEQFLEALMYITPELI
ncbi:hypothetical protein T01_10964 [Trichinella spiralis]|uniref:MULE transposase domain-containing protein n=1 Tax=Trichinella spiralis TaxID=6334 RepID=A0A0V1AXU3_TRISP|nr:hypothetical protein T01_10964 [Trichinella spiralis]